MRRRHRRTAIGLAAGAVLMGAPALPAGAAKSPSPETLYQQSKAATRHQSSVHYFVQSKGGKDIETTTGDAGTHQGTKVISLSVSGKRGTIKIVQIGQSLYLEGDDFGLTELRFPAATAAKAAGHWISIPPKDQLFKTISAGMNYTSAVGQISMKRPFKSGGTRTVDGTPSYVLHVRFGTTKDLVPAQYFVARAAPHLPVGYQLSEVVSGVNTSGVVELNHWGEHVTAHRPTHTVPISTYGL